MPVLLVLALGAFGLITSELGIIGILPQLSDALGVSIQTAGWLLSGFALAVAVAGPGMTLLFSGVNRKWSLCIVLATFVLSNLASAVAPNFAVLLVLRVLPAFVHPVFWSVAMSVAAASVPPERSARAVSIVFTGMSAGIVFGVPLAAFVASQANWNGAFLVFGTLNLLALIAHLLFLPQMPVRNRQAIGAQLGVLRKGIMWWNLALQVAMTAAVFSIYGFMAEYLKQVTGMSPTLISAMLFLFGIAGVFGTIVAGRLMSHNINRSLAGFLIALAPILLALFLVGRSMPATIALIVFWGFVHSAAVPLCQSIVLRAAPDAPEFSNSLFNSFGNIGITGGTTVGGYAIASIGIAALPLVSVALLAISALLFAVERSRYGDSPLDLLGSKR